MKEIVNKITQGATRLLVLALGLGLVSTGWAADPVAIWDGDFSVTQQGYTLNLNDNSLSSDNSIITIDQSVGITVEASGTFNGGFTVLFKYSNLNVALAAKQVLATTTLTDAEARTGVTIGTSGLSCGIWAGGSWNDSGTFNSMNISNQTAGVLGYTHYSSSNYSGGTGTRLFYLKNGVATTILNAGTLGSNNDISKYKGFSIGGLKTAASGFSAATGMKIAGIAVFQGVLSEAELKAYVWPSAKVGGVASGAAKYTDWDYADDMVTWALDSTGELASGTAKFGLFDTHAGSIPLTFVGNANAVFYPNAGGSAEAFWHKLSNGSVSGTYKAPGMALRFAGSATGKSIGGTYGPVTIGGMYVESGASGYSLTQAGNVKRTTILGNPYDPDGVTNSVFRFEEPFTIARTGVLCLSGAINIVLPEGGDTLTLNKTADNGNVAYAPQIVQKVTGLSNDGIITIGTHTTPGGTLKMHGEGTIEAVQLTASGATLDFSDLGSRANTTPFINCPLVVDANTSFVLPTGATFPYKVATAISGTVPATDTVYTDANGNVFTGPISIDTENGTVTFDPLSASTIEVNGALTISGATAANINIPAGKTLTLASGAALTGTVTGSGTVVCNQVDLSGAGFDNASGWTGKVQIAGDASMPTTYFDESSYGNANSTLEIASGHVAITAATALPGTVNVASGATLYMTSSSLTSLAISGTNNGTVNLQMAAALATLSLDNGIARGTIVYPSSLTTLNVSLAETLADDGRASFTCSGATPTSGTLTLTRPDGTTENIAGTVDGATISFAWAPAVSGSAAWCAYEFETSDSTALKNTGSDPTALSKDGTFSEATSVDGDGKLYTYSHPYRNITYPADGNWSAMVRCTVPKLAEAIVVTFGTRGAGLIGLAAGATPDSEMYLVQTTNGGGSYDSHYVTNAVMPVLNGTTAQHVYVFTVANNQTVKIYCDNELIETKVFDSPFTIGGGIQIGAIHGGIGSVGLHACRADGTAADPAYSALSEADQKAARVDSMRLYKGVLGPNAIAQLSEEFPAVKLFEATISGGNANVWGSLAWTGGDISTINAYSKAIITVEDDATLTLPASITADELVINIAAGKTLTLVEAGDGTTFAINHPVEVNTGAVAFGVSSKTLNFAIGGGTGSVFVDAGKTVSVVSGGSLSRVSGSGTVTYASYGSLPGALAFGEWTGTVVLPSFSADALNFNNYGKSGSTVEITAITGGWIAQAGTTVTPTLKLSGNMTIDAMSPWNYTFAEITGSGSLSFSTSNANPGSITITKVAEGYSGTINNSTTTTLTITTLDRAAATPVTAGSKVLSTSSGVQASALTLAGVATGIIPVFDTDGLYVKAASVTKNDTTTYYDTVSDATTALGSDAGTLTLLMSTDSAITLAVGQTLVNGNLTTGGVTGPNGYEVVNNNGTYTLVDNTASTWTDASGDHSWANAQNWSTGYIPSQYTAVTFPASESAHVVGLSLNNASSESARHHCASMTLNGDVTFQRANAGTWAYVQIYGNVSGSGTLTFLQTGLRVPANGSATISCPVVCNAASNDNFFSGSDSGNETFTFSGAVDIVAGELKADYAHLVFNGPVTIRDGGYVKSSGNSTASATFNGGIIVPADAAAASLTVVNNGGAHTIASTVTLAAGATLTVPNSTVTTAATFTTSDADGYVKTAVGAHTTEYSVATKTVVTVSVGSNVSLAINDNAVSDGDTLKFAPGDTFTYAATPAANYTAAVTVTGGTDNSGTVTVGETAVTVAATATRDAVSVSNVAFAYGNDYATADVTATVSDPTATYKMTVGVNEYTGVVSGTTVTFTGVETGHASAYDNVSYTITATDGASSVDVTGGSGSAVVATTTAWINENASTHVGGTWSPAVSYANGAAEVSDNQFSATTASTSSRVVLEFDICFAGATDDEVEGGAQAAIKIGTVNDTPTFMVLTNANAWAAVSHADLVADPAATNKVVLTIDYGTKTYEASVAGLPLTNSVGSARFPLAASRTNVKDIDFAGSGVVKSIKGDQVEGYMVKDGQNNFYATIEAATQAYSSANGPYTVLHPGTPPDGWQIVNDVLKKVVKGFLLITF